MSVYLEWVKKGTRNTVWIWNCLLLKDTFKITKSKLKWWLNPSGNSSMYYFEGLDIRTLLSSLEPSSWEVAMKSPRIPPVSLLSFPSLSFFSGRGWVVSQDSNHPSERTPGPSTGAPRDRHRKHERADDRQGELKLLSLHLQLPPQAHLDPPPPSQPHWDRQILIRENAQAQSPRVPKAALERCIRKTKLPEMRERGTPQMPSPMQMKRQHLSSPKNTAAGPACSGWEGESCSGAKMHGLDDCGFDPALLTAKKPWANCSWILQY